MTHGIIESLNISNNKVFLEYDPISKGVMSLCNGNYSLSYIFLGSFYKGMCFSVFCTKFIDHSTFVTIVF